MQYSTVQYTHYKTIARSTFLPCTDDGEVPRVGGAGCRGSFTLYLIELYEYGSLCREGCAAVAEVRVKSVVKLQEIQRINKPGDKETTAAGEGAEAQIV